jgi:hypothetical protein
MYFSQQEIILLHEERVKHLKQMAQPIAMPRILEFLRHIWTTLHNMLRHESSLNRTQTTQGPSPLATQEFAIIHEK